MVKKIPLCILCLTKGTKEHDCPVGKCAKCSEHHNIIMCPKTEEESALKVGEMHDDSSTDSEDEEVNDYTCNRESINVLIKGGESSKTKHKDKPKKEGKENRDDNVETSVKEAKEDKLSKLKGVLKIVANGYETGKKTLLKVKSPLLLQREHVHSEKLRAQVPSQTLPLRKRVS